MRSNLWFFFSLIWAETARIIAEPTDTHLKRSPAVIGIACHWALRTEWKAKHSDLKLFCGLRLLIFKTIAWSVNGFSDYGFLFINLNSTYHFWVNCACYSNFAAARWKFVISGIPLNTIITKVVLCKKDKLSRKHKWPCSTKIEILYTKQNCDIFCLVKYVIFVSSNFETSPRKPFPDSSGKGSLTTPHEPLSTCQGGIWRGKWLLWPWQLLRRPWQLRGFGMSGSPDIYLTRGTVVG